MCNLNSDITGLCQTPTREAPAIVKAAHSQTLASSSLPQKQRSCVFIPSPRAMLMHWYQTQCPVQSNLWFKAIALRPPCLRGILSPGETLSGIQQWTPKGTARLAALTRHSVLNATSKWVVTAPEALPASRASPDSSDQQMQSMEEPLGSRYFYLVYAEGGGTNLHLIHSPVNWKIWRSAAHKPHCATDIDRSSPKGS